MGFGDNSSAVSRVLLVVFIILSIATGYQVWSQNNDLEKAEDRTEALEQTQTLSDSKVALLVEQLEDLGARPVVRPEDLQEALDDLEELDGTAPVISDAAIALAVFNYCSGDRCAKEPTPAQVAAAVSQYCNARGECRGAEGKIGPTGETGSTGATGATGEQGPPPSDEQVLNAVRTYCENNGGCRGPQGERGEAGRGITSIACEPTTQEFVITYTDGTSANVVGSDCVAGNGNQEPELPVDP